MQSLYIKEALKSSLLIVLIIGNFKWFHLFDGQIYEKKSLLRFNCPIYYYTKKYNNRVRSVAHCAGSFIYIRRSAFRALSMFCK